MGTIKSILIRPEKRGEPRHIDKAKIFVTGIEGDHFVRPDGSRQVTLVAADDLATMSAVIGFEGDAHAACRRNICVDTFPYEDMKGRHVALGDEVILEITCYCFPCKRMDENFGEGAVNAFDKKAGWGAKVLQEGQVHIGDEFRVL